MESEINGVSTSNNIYDIEITLDVKAEPFVNNLVEEQGDAMANHDLFEASSNQDERICLSVNEDHICKYRHKLTPVQKEFNVMKTELATTKVQLRKNTEVNQPERLQFLPVATTGTTLDQDGRRGTLSESGIFSVGNYGINEAAGSSNSTTAESIPDIISSNTSPCGEQRKSGISFIISSDSTHSRIASASPNKNKTKVNKKSDVLQRQPDFEYQNCPDRNAVNTCRDELREKTTRSNNQQHSGLTRPTNQSDQRDVLFVSFKCSKCYKVFVHKQHLINHEKIHEDEDSFRCIQCSKRYNTRNGLQSHMIVHTNRFQCIFCQKCCQNNWALEDHLRCHTKERPFECQQCESCYQSKSHLSWHFKRVHRKNTSKLYLLKQEVTPSQNV